MVGPHGQVGGGWTLCELGKIGVIFVDIFFWEAPYESITPFLEEYRFSFS